MTSKDLNKIRSLISKQGWRIKSAGTGHEQWYSPDGVTILTVSRNPSSPKTLTSIKVRLRNAGVKGI